ncbi:MAG: hypothetical protein GY854_18875, partial [Deltaproteobacteria bacterium]|nr:hypothetical protein [Deltaproteobacteria bacterium]
ERLQQFDQAIDCHRRAGDPESVARATRNKELKKRNDKLQQLDDEKAEILQALDDLARRAAAEDPGSHDR